MKVFMKSCLRSVTSMSHTENTAGSVGITAFFYQADI